MEIVLCPVAGEFNQTYFVQLRDRYYYAVQWANNLCVFLTRDGRECN